MAAEPAPKKAKVAAGGFAARDEIAKTEEAGGSIRFVVVKNDGDMTNLERLITLKNIFAKQARPAARSFRELVSGASLTRARATAQLPKMPKEYIVRLTFDRRHFSLALVKGETVVGGICYRPCFEQRFAEIAFCAITASEQASDAGEGGPRAPNPEEICGARALRFAGTAQD